MYVGVGGFVDHYHFALKSDSLGLLFLQPLFKHILLF